MEIEFNNTIYKSGQENDESYTGGIWDLSIDFINTYAPDLDIDLKSQIQEGIYNLIKYNVLHD